MPETVEQRPNVVISSASLQQFRTLRQGSAGFLAEETEDDPLAALANLFDVAMVFAVALMVSLISYLQVPALLKDKDYTIITDPGTPEMEIIVKEGQEIKQYEASESKGAGKGQLLGQAYQLPDGRVIYVPADGEASSTP
ncbi:DUF2149 domain-containing protein [Gimesia sp.]|uniref:DUF2149 domain-containing protein n=1 Tax=Gimesia sp. TaxID=2024833 RepID=UPI003A9066AF